MPWIPRRMCAAAAGLTAALLLLAAEALPAAASAATPAAIESCRYTSDAGHSHPFCSTGKTTGVTVQPGGLVNYTFGYPGDSSSITFTAQITPLPNISAGTVGFNVFDVDHPLSNGLPAETATTLTNQIDSDPTRLQFNYSSGRNGVMTLQLFNYSAVAETFALDFSGLAETNGQAAPMTLQLVGGASEAGLGDCGFYEGMGLFVNRSDGPGGQLMGPVVGACLANEYSDPATGNVYQRTANGTLSWTKSANRVDFTNGPQTWYGCLGGIVVEPSSLPFNCRGQ